MVTMEDRVESLGREVAGRLLHTRLKIDPTLWPPSSQSSTTFAVGWHFSTAPMTRTGKPQSMHDCNSKSKRSPSGWPPLFDREAAALVLQFQKRRIRIGTMDLNIACIAITHDATLLTRITVDFAQVLGLRYENW